jgi:hypothetical protein
MIKILTCEDNYYEYELAVIETGDCLEDWDYIIIPDKQLSEDDNYSIGRVADRLEINGNKAYRTKDGKDFIVVYH